MIRVVVVDDHPIVRAGILRLIEAEDDLCVVAEAWDAQTLTAQIEQWVPDVLIMDLEMPVDAKSRPSEVSPLVGLNALESIRIISPATNVVILTMHAGPDVVRRSIDAGAVGYIVKQSIGSELLAAVRAASRGSVYIDSEVSFVLTVRAPRQETFGADSLSPRESQVVKLVVEGLSTREIASQLNVSPKTVEKQRRDAMRKLQVNNVAGLVRTVIDSRRSEDG